MRCWNGLTLVWSRVENANGAIAGKCLWSSYLVSPWKHTNTSHKLHRKRMDKMWITGCFIWRIFDFCMSTFFSWGQGGHPNFGQLSKGSRGEKRFRQLLRLPPLEFSGHFDLEGCSHHFKATGRSLWKSKPRIGGFCRANECKWDTFLSKVHQSHCDIFRFQLPVFPFKSQWWSPICRPFRWFDDIFCWLFMLCKLKRIDLYWFMLILTDFIWFDAWILSSQPIDGQKPAQGRPCIMIFSCRQSASWHYSIAVDDCSKAKR